MAKTQLVAVGQVSKLMFWELRVKTALKKCWYFFWGDDLLEWEQSFTIATAPDPLSEPVPLAAVAAAAAVSPLAAAASPLLPSTSGTVDGFLASEWPPVEAPRGRRREGSVVGSTSRSSACVIQSR